MTTTGMAGQLFPARFEVRSWLGEGGMGIVYEVFDRETSAHLAAKTLRRMAPEHLYFLKNEFRKLADVQHKNLVQLGELFYDAQQCFFTMELVRGENFRNHVRWIERVAPAFADLKLEDSKSPLSPDSYFTPSGGTGLLMPLMASASRGTGQFDEGRLRDSLRQLSEAIAALHVRGLVHRDLKPSNVMIEPSGRLVVLDFGLADTLRSDNDNAETVYGTAAYMAPEQASKPRAVDGACDWYAFGVMLFNALTGRLPFEGPASFVLKAKQALDAPRVSTLIEDCPPDLDALCAALLSRDPKDRPAANQVIEQLAREQKPRSATRRLRAEDVFVGRVAELAQLSDALERSGRGSFEAVLVEGPPGVGKTELVEHFLVQAKLDSRPLIILRGRCYEQEFVPFKGIDAVVDSLSRHLKALPFEAARALLPPRLNLVAALFPVLYRVPAVAGLVPPLEVNESSSEQRTEAILQLGQLLSAVARTGRVVVFIDDLQWAQTDSFELLRTLYEGAAAPPVLLLATCRTTDRWERDAMERDLVELPARLSASVLSLFERMTITPLNSDEARQLMHKLWTRPEDAADEYRFRELLDEARGHPLFLQELARYADSIGQLPRNLRLDHVLRERIAKLDEGARKLLEVAAIAGVPLPARVLARVAAMSKVDSVAALRLLRSEQLIRTDSGTGSHSVEPYHDRVREAVVEGIRDGSYVSALGMDLASTQLELAHQLIRAQAEDDLFVPSTTLANLFNLGASAIFGLEQVRAAVRSNAEAAYKVKFAGAYDAALHYLNSARGHSRALPESERIALEREMDLLEMELAYRWQDESRSRALFERLTGAGSSDLEVAKAYETRIMVETAKNQLDRALGSAREGLARLGMSFPERGKEHILLREIAAFELRLRGRNPRTLLDLPETRDARVRAQMQILMASTPAGYFSDPVLMSIAVVRMAKLSLMHGMSELSPYGFCGYAVVLSGGFQAYQRAFQFSTLARELNERLQNHALSAKIEHLHSFICGPYVMTFDECRPLLSRVQELGLKNGDLSFRTYGAICTPMLTLTAGEPLEQMKAECVQGVRAAEQEGHVDMAGQTEWRLRAIRCLSGENPDPLHMDGESSTEREFLNVVESGHMPTSNFAYGLLQTVLGVHFDAPRLALAGAERANQFAHVQFGLITLIDLSLYQLLAACQLIEQGVSRSERHTLSKLVKINLAKLEKWSRAFPQNFAGHALLARAEWTRLNESAEQAEKALRAAAAHAEEFKRHNVAGLAYERLAAFKEKQGGARGAQEALSRAADAYRRWGAHARVRQLEKRLRSNGR